MRVGILKLSRFRLITNLVSKHTIGMVILRAHQLVLEIEHKLQALKDSYQNGFTVK